MSPIRRRRHETGPPILVTGSHRSGTTWVGSMLASAPGVAHVHEPLNPVYRLSWLDVPPDHAFQFIGPHNEDRYGPAFDRVVALRPPLRDHLRSVRSARNLAANVREVAQLVSWRVSGARPLVKDPLAVFSAEFLARRFDARVVALIRHPAAFAGSLKRMGWYFDFHDFVDQPELMSTHLDPFAAEIRRAANAPPDIIDQAILLWRCINATLVRYRAEHPDWRVVRYEDVASDPLAGARALYEHTGLAWTSRVEGRIRALSSAENPTEVAAARTRDVRRNSSAAMSTWHRRLTEREIERVRQGTADVAAGLYDDGDWVVPTDGRDPDRSASSRSNSAT